MTAYMFQAILQEYKKHVMNVIYGRVLLQGRKSTKNCQEQDIKTVKTTQCF